MTKTQFTKSVKAHQIDSFDATGLTFVLLNAYTHHFKVAPEGTALWDVEARMIIHYTDIEIRNRKMFILGCEVSNIKESSPVIMG